MLRILFAVISWVHADTDTTVDTAVWGMRLEVSPQTLNDEFQTQYIQWTPWLKWSKWQNEGWVFKGSLRYNGSSTQSKTAESSFQSSLSEVTLGTEVERRFGHDDLTWLVGFGAFTNIPFIVQQSSEYTTSEQSDIDAQLQNKKAETAYTQFRVPVTLLIPITKHLSFGLGASFSLNIQRSQSDFETVLETQTQTVPLLILDIQ